MKAAGSRQGEGDPQKLVMLPKLAAKDSVNLAGGAIYSSGSGSDGEDGFRINFDDQSASKHGVFAPSSDTQPDWAKRTSAGLNDREEIKVNQYLPGRTADYLSSSPLAGGVPSYSTQKTGHQYASTLKKDAYNANNWKYDEDEENTAKTIELQSMSLENAQRGLMGVPGSAAEMFQRSYNKLGQSPLQNHYISSSIGLRDTGRAAGANSSRTGRLPDNDNVYSQEKFDQMFANADMHREKESTRINVSMSYAEDEDESSSGFPSSSTYKSRIGAPQAKEPPTLKAPGSRPSMANYDHGGSLNDDKAYAYTQHMLQVYPTEAEQQAQQAELSSSYLRQQQKEALERKSYKLST